jgi:type II secretory pathway predicted ATPase ExeA
VGYRKVIFNWAGRKYMPINLKWVLQRNGISQARWCREVKQMDGKPLSNSAGSDILNYNNFPKLTPMHSIKAQTEHLLRQAGASDEEIKVAWDHDEGDRGRDQHPTGVHEGAQMRAAEKRKAKQNNAPIDIDFLETEMLSPEAKQHFNLPANPFQGDPGTDKEFFVSPDVSRVMSAINYAVKHPSILAIIGESGSGKTTLFNFTRDKLARETTGLRMIIPACIDKKTLTAEQIVEAIILDLDPFAKVPQKKESRTRMARRLLTDSTDAGSKHLLMIEEAHDLSIQTLKQLKRFFEIGEGLKRVMSILLIGQPELRDKLNERTSYDAREFIRRCEIEVLHPLDKHLEKYLELRLQRVERPLASLFDKDAFDAIRERLTPRGSQKTLSQTYPLIVNGLVTRALNQCAEIGAPKVSAAVIRDL